MSLFSLLRDKQIEQKINTDMKLVLVKYEYVGTYKHFIVATVEQEMQ